MKIDHKRYWESHRADRQKMKYYREKMHEHIERYAGGHAYPKAKVKNLANKMELAVNIYSRILMPKRPHYMVTGKYAGLEGSAELFELALNQLGKEIRIENTLKRCVKSSLFLMGISKAGLRQGSKVEIGGVFHDIGQPYLDCVEYDDFVFDMEAKTFEQMQHMGDRFTIPYVTAIESELYDNSLLRKHRPIKDTHSETNVEGDDKLSRLSRENIQMDDRYMEVIELWEVYFPHERKVVTYSTEMMEQSRHIPLREVDYYGAESGPYDFLSLDDVPGQLMPMPPVSVWRDMSDLITSLYKKMANMSRHTKNIGIGQKGDDADVTKVNSAKDGDFITLINPANAQRITLGGIDQTLFAFALSMDEQFSMNAGNLRNLGGLSSEAETLGQETLITNQASTRINEMLSRTIDFSRKAGEKIAWYLKNDPFIKIPAVFRHPVANDVPITITAEDIENDYFEYNFDVDPYSRVDMTPQKVFQAVTQYLQQVFLPLLPFSMDAGGPVDLQYLNHFMARMLQIPDLERIVKIGGQSTMGNPIEPGQARQSPNTTRTNVRVNRSTATPEGQSSQLQNRLLSGSNDGPDMNRLANLFQ